MFKEIKQILENAKGETIGLFTKADKTICPEIDSSEPKTLFTASNLEYEIKGSLIKLFDKLNPENHFKINIADFIGANVSTSEFWIGANSYILMSYS